MNIVMIRHPTVHNPEGRCYGQSEMPLEDISDEFTRPIHSFLTNFSPDRVLTSPSDRCTAFAELLGFQAAQREDRLRELNFGDWEQRKWTDIQKKDLNRWMRNYYFEQVPKGESFEELNNRTLELLHEILHPDRPDIKNILLITHSGPIKCILGHFLHLNPYETMKWSIPYGGIWEVKRGSNGLPVVYPPAEWVHL